MLTSAQKLESKFLMQTYARHPLAIERGRGCWVYDHAGKRYLDFVSGIGVNALGHAHPRIVKVIREQAARLLHTSNLYFHDYQGPLAARLAKLAGLDRVFFCNSGTEAIEGALKIARAHSAGTPGKTKIVALENSFHGRTLGALAATWTEKYRKPFVPLIPGVDFVRAGDAAGLQARITAETSAVLIEPIQGEGGIREIDDGFLRQAAGAARAFGALLILDEIQCGLGRTGDWFAFERSGVKPDVVVVAKPMAAGLPMGAIIASQQAASALSAGLHGATFGGGPLVCRAALEFLDVLQEEKLLANVRRMGRYFMRGLQKMARQYSLIRLVRGRGLMLAIELDRPSRPLAEAALAEGLLVNSTADTVLRFLPPYTVTESEVDRALAILAGVFARAANG